MCVVGLLGTNAQKKPTKAKKSVASLCRECPHICMDFFVSCALGKDPFDNGSVFFSTRQPTVCVRLGYTVVECYYHCATTIR